MAYLVISNSDSIDVPYTPVLMLLLNLRRPSRPPPSQPLVRLVNW
jgi:hypothetical protein